MVAAHIFIADEDRRHRQQEGPGRGDGGAADIEDTEARQQASQRELGYRNQDGAGLVRGFLAVGARFQHMQDGNGDARHQQIDDEHRLGYGMVDLAEGGAVEGKAARQRQGRNLPFVLSGPADGRVEGRGVKSAHGGSYGWGPKP